MQITENFSMAFQTLRSSKLRSGLTLLGICVGVLSIIGVMTAIGVLQNAIESGLNILGTNSFQIQKYPALNFSNPRLKFRNRKDIDLEQGELFLQRMHGAKAVALSANFSGDKQIFHEKNKTNPNVNLVGISLHGFLVNNWTIDQGRAFTSEEIDMAQKVCVIGDKVVEKLFPFSSPIGEEVKLDGLRFRVVGTTEPKGSFLGGNQDNYVVVPITTGMNLYGKQRSLNIVVQTNDSDSYQETIEIARGVLRVIRRVPSGKSDDFEIFSNDMLIDQFNNFTFLVKVGAVGLATIALLAAGVGIMNIMLVAVTERTKEIGIRKALGATKANILSQFLTEALVFSQLGGICGIALGSLLGNSLAIILKAPFIMPWNNTVAILQTPFLAFTALEINLVSFLFCSFIGVVFGVYPAWKAGNLNPIESLRYE